MRWAIWITLVLLVAWRAVWLSSGVRDVTAEADRVRADAIDAIASTGRADAYMVMFAKNADDALPSKLNRIQDEIWDSELPIWITPGTDGMPGWAGWDDNRNGEVDEAIELGAAWSDDFCVVETNDLPTPPSGRIIDHGAFRKSTSGERPDRVCFTWK